MSEDIKTPDSQVDVDEMEKTDTEQDNLDQVEGIETTASDAARPEGVVLEDDVAEANDNNDDDERTDLSLIHIWVPTSCGTATSLLRAPRPLSPRASSRPPRL